MSLIIVNLDQVDVLHNTYVHMHKNICLHDTFKTNLYIQIIYTYLYIYIDKDKFNTIVYKYT